MAVALRIGADQQQCPEEGGGDLHFDRKKTTVFSTKSFVVVEAGVIPGDERGQRVRLFTRNKKRM